MIPQQVATLDKLPLTCHGKIDKAFLPEIVTQFNAGTQPNNELELGIQKIWEEVLKIPQPSIDDSFL
jgi:hypothetical protein